MLWGFSVTKASFLSGGGEAGERRVVSSCYNVSKRGCSATFSVTVKG